MVLERHPTIKLKPGQITYVPMIHTGKRYQPVLRSLVEIRDSKKPFTIFAEDFSFSQDHEIPKELKFRRIFLPKDTSLEEKELNSVQITPVEVDPNQHFADMIYNAIKKSVSKVPGSKVHYDVVDKDVAEHVRKHETTEKAMTNAFIEGDYEKYISSAEENHRQKANLVQKSDINMLREIEHELEANPDKPILVIRGAAHGLDRLLKYRFGEEAVNNVNLEAHLTYPISSMVRIMSKGGNLTRETKKATTYKTMKTPTK